MIRTHVEDSWDLLEQTQALIDEYQRKTNILALIEGVPVTTQNNILDSPINEQSIYYTPVQPSLIPRVPMPQSKPLN